LTPPAEFAEIAELSTILHDSTFHAWCEGIAFLPGWGMALSRRQVLQSIAAAAALPAFAKLASAIDYPSRPVRIFEGFGAGSTPDLVSRLIGQWLSAQLGQPFVVENRTGAGGSVAAEVVVTAPPDGYTILTCVTANTINAALDDRLDFNLLRDFAPVAGIVRVPMVLLVNLSFPVTTLPEFIAYAKSNPGKINIASPGVGTPMHLAIELLKMMAGIDIVHVPYRGPAPAMTDLLAGHIQAFLITVSTALGAVKSDKVRALAVTSANRAEVLPDIPSIGEVLPGFEANSWNGFCVPKDTPARIVETLSVNIAKGLADPRLKSRFGELGEETVPMSSVEFTKFVGDESDKWARIVKSAGVKAN
jgi:tripartite-type tricarboxylate transporter receptor subunit TctC